MFIVCSRLTTQAKPRGQPLKEPKSEAANPDGFSALAAVGEAQAHPWVRWGGLPGRRCHSSKTQSALGLISTVRIGAGAWRKLANTRQSGDTDQASTQIHCAQKGRGNRRTKDQKLLRKELRNRAKVQEPAHVAIEKPKRLRARLRSTPLRSARPTPHSKNTGGKSTTLLTTLIGAAAHG